MPRFNDLWAVNRFTSASSTIVYRDDLFGPVFAGNAFVSEPVHNLVHREIDGAAGVLFTSRRADDEQRPEFLASATTGFARPCCPSAPTAHCGWPTCIARRSSTAVDSARSAKETRPAGRPRHGPHLSRVSRRQRSAAIPRLDRMSTAELAAAIDSPSGWQRETAQQLLIWHDDRAAVEPLAKLAADSHARPRVQALWTLEALGVDCGPRRSWRQ